jgi:hypothetical protein
MHLLLASNTISDSDMTSNWNNWNKVFDEQMSDYCALIVVKFQMQILSKSELSTEKRSESAVRPIGTERCGTGRAFGKSCRIDLIVLRISERLLPVMMEFQAATNLSRDPYGIVCYVCLRQSR